MLYESLIVCKHGNILLSLTFKENKISFLFYLEHIIEIPTNKGANSYNRNLSKTGNTYMGYLQYSGSHTYINTNNIR